MKKNIIIYTFFFLFCISCSKEYESDFLPKKDENIEFRGDVTLNIVSWNTFLLDANLSLAEEVLASFAGAFNSDIDPPFCEGEACFSRGERVAQSLKYNFQPPSDASFDPEFDIICLQEVFVDRGYAGLLTELNRITNGRGGGYIFTAFDGGRPQNDILGSGLVTASRFPIVFTERVNFNDCFECGIGGSGCGSDCHALKGFLHTTIDVNGTNIEIINTHTDASNSLSDALTRNNQFCQISNYINNNFNLAQRNRVIIMGDMNTERRAGINGVLTQTDGGCPLPGTGTFGGFPDMVFLLNAISSSDLANVTPESTASNFQVLDYILYPQWPFSRTIFQNVTHRVATEYFYSPIETCDFSVSSFLAFYGFVNSNFGTVAMEEVIDAVNQAGIEIIPELYSTIWNSYLSYQSMESGNNIIYSNCSTRRVTFNPSDHKPVISTFVCH